MRAEQSGGGGVRVVVTAVQPRYVVNSRKHSYSTYCCSVSPDFPCLSLYFSFSLSPSLTSMTHPPLFSRSFVPSSLHSFPLFGCHRIHCYFLLPSVELGIILGLHITPHLYTQLYTFPELQNGVNTLKRLKTLTTFGTGTSINNGFCV